MASVTCNHNGTTNGVIELLSWPDRRGGGALVLKTAALRNSCFFYGFINKQLSLLLKLHKNNTTVVDTFRFFIKCIYYPQIRWRIALKIDEYLHWFKNEWPSFILHSIFIIMHIQLVYIRNKSLQLKLSWNFVLFSCLLTTTIRCYCIWSDPSLIIYSSVSNIPSSHVQGVRTTMLASLKTIALFFSCQVSASGCFLLRSVSSSSNLYNPIHAA